MRRWVIAAIIAMLVITIVGVVLTYIPKLRRNAAETACRNNLREIGLFAVHHAEEVGAVAKVPLPPGVAAGQLVPEIPAGTVVLPDVAPDNRLSWYVAAMPGLDQKRQSMAPLLAGLDVKAPWAADRN